MYAKKSSKTEPDTAKKRISFNNKKLAKFLTVKRYKKELNFYRFSIRKTVTLSGTKISKSKATPHAKTANCECRRERETLRALLHDASRPQNRNWY